MKIVKSELRALIERTIKEQLVSDGPDGQSKFDHVEWESGLSRRTKDIDKVIDILDDKLTYFIQHMEKHPDISGFNARTLEIAKQLSKSISQWYEE